MTTQPDRSRPAPRRIINHRMALIVAMICGIAGTADAQTMAVRNLGLICVGYCIPTAIYYVDATAGSDTNAGTSPAAAWATIGKAAATMGSGDELYLSGIFRLSSGVTFSNLSNITIAQTPGATPADIRWETIPGVTWTPIGGDKYTATLAAGLGSGGGASALRGSLMTGYEFTSDPGGRGRGHLGYLVGTASYESYEYDNATGAATIKTAADPNSAAGQISYSVSSSGQAISISGGTNNKVMNLRFSLHCGAAASYGLIITNNAGTKVIGCTFRDATGHHSGFLNFAGGPAAIGNQYVSCTFYGGAAGLGHAVHYAQNNTVAISGGRYTGCVFHAHRFLDRSGTTCVGQSATTQVGAMGHGDSGTECVLDLEASHCSFLEHEPGWVPFAVAQQAACSPTWVWADCPARMHGCYMGGDGINQTGASRFVTTTNLARRSCVMDYRNIGPSGLGRASGIGGIILQTSSPQFTLDESCAIIINARDDGQDVRAMGTFGAANELRYLNTSIYEVSTGHNGGLRGLIGVAFRTDVYVRMRGCAIGCAESWSGNRLISESSTVAADHLDIIDNAYFQLTSFSQNGTFDSGAEWLALIDTQMRSLATQPFTRYAADATLAIDSTSSLWPVRRQSSLVVPGSGINGAFDSGYGAYQPILPATLTMGRGISAGAIGLGAD